MDRNSISTFHYFTRLPTELRIRIWELCTADDRVVRVYKQWWPHRYIWSPTPVPSVTRASQEARKYCRYQQLFVIEGSPRYIWTCFEHDRIQMASSLMAELSKGSAGGDGKKNIRHLRLQMVSSTERDESEMFFDRYMHCIGDFPNLQSCEVLVDNLMEWGNTIIEEVSWGACPKSSVRFVDKKTGEYITAENGGAYVDWIETEGGTRGYFLSVRDEVWNLDYDEEARVQAMMKMKDGLPRITVDW